MHDSSMATLQEVVEFYSKRVNPNSNLDREIRPLNLTTDERNDLIAFHHSLGFENENENEASGTCRFVTRHWSFAGAPHG